MEMASQASPSSVSATTPIDDGEDGPNGLDPNRWFFEKERLEFTPSRKCGIDADKELAYRQQSANFIQDMGQRLQVNQLCINTAIVYMHRFYMYHSFSHFHRNHVSTASIFLAAKVEEQPRKLEHVIKVAHYCLNRESQPIDVKSENYAEQTSELVMTENILLQTLGFDVAIDHPHTHVVKCCQLVRASKDLAQTSYFMATNSLHLTTMCLQYKPTVVACVCIHLTCKWSNWEIPRSKEGRDWFWYVDDTVTIDQLEKLTTEFLTIFDKSPSRLKKKILSLNQASGGSSSLTLSSFPTFNLDPTSPGAPTFPPSRSHSPATATSLYGSSSSLGKRSSSSLKPGTGSQINNKQGKVNGGIGHHPVKPPHGSQNPPSNSSSSKHPHYSSSSSSSSKGILPPGSHHGAKDAHVQQQHVKQPGHHHSSSGHGPQAYPHGTGSRPSSSHSHASGHLSQSHAPPTGQPPKPTSGSSTSSSSSHAMGGQHPSKPQLPQPSKVPYNYNIKSQPPPPQQLASGQPPSSKSSSNSLSQSSSNPPVNKIHAQPPPYNQIKKPYPDASRRENSATGDFNGKRESADDINRRTNLNSQSQSRSRPSDKAGDLFSTGAGSMSNLPPLSLPFNASTTAEPTTRSWVDTSSSIATSNTNNLSIIEPPRIPPGRTSLFSPDPEIPETSISSSIQSIVKSELSPLGGDIGGLGGAKGDHSTDNPFSAHTSSIGSASLFPNLFEFGIGGRSSSSSNDPTSFITDLKPDTGSSMGLGSSSSVGVSGILGGGGNHNNSDMIITDSSVLSSSLSSAPVSTSTLSSVTMPMNSITCSNISLTSPINPGGGLPPDILDITGEPPHKKSKKNKKEKHKHKDKEKDKHHDDKKEKKDKDEKKRNKDKNKDKSKDDKKHKDKGDKEKHKKDKHKDKERDKSKGSKHPGPGEAGSPGYTDGAGNKIKFTFGSRMDAPTQEKPKSKHSSKKHSSKSSTASSETSSSTVAPSAPSIKLKIVPLRPPSSKDDSKIVFTSKPN